MIDVNYEHTQYIDLIQWQQKKGIMIINYLLFCHVGLQFSFLTCQLTLSWTSCCWGCFTDHD